MTPIPALSEILADIVPQLQIANGVLFFSWYGFNIMPSYGKDNPMNVEMRFKPTKQGDAIAYLAAADTDDNGAFVVRSEDDFRKLVLDIMGGRNCMRKILITDSEESARTVAILCRGDMRGEVIINRITDDIHAVGVTARDLTDSGIPWISDLREKGPRLVLDADFPITSDWQSPGEIYVDIEHEPLVLVGDREKDILPEPDSGPDL